MPLALFLYVIAALACGWGEPSSAGGQDASAAPGPASATPELPPLVVGTSSPVAPSTVSGPPRANKYLQLGVTEAGFDSGRSAPPGLRYYTVGLRGIGRSRGNDFLLEFQRFVFAQNEHGCISRPVPNATWLKRPFGKTAIFTSANPTEGQLAFLVPDDSLRIRVLIAPVGPGGLVVPAGKDFTPAWPTPIQTIEDGSTLRVLVLPSPALPAALPPPAAGRKQVVLDFVIENLKSTQGIEFTTSQQLRLIDQSGTFIQPSALTKQIGCRLDDGDVIPPGHSRRFQAVYDMPAGESRRLQYRGFEVDETTVDLE